MKSRNKENQMITGVRKEGKVLMSEGRHASRVLGQE